MTLTPEQDQRLRNIEQWAVHEFAGEVTGTWPHSDGVVPKIVPNEKLNAIAVAVSDIKTQLETVIELLSSAGGPAGGPLPETDVQRIAEAVADEEHRRSAD